MVWVRKLPRITHSERMTDYTDVKRIREELPTMQPEHEPMAPRCLDEPYKRGCQEKILPLSSPRGDGWWLASSRISVPERLWAGRVFRTDRAVGGLYSTVS